MDTIIPLHSPGLSLKCQVATYMKLLHGEFDILEVLLAPNFPFDSNEGSQKPYWITVANSGP